MQGVRRPQALLRTSYSVCIPWSVAAISPFFPTQATRDRQTDTYAGCTGARGSFVYYLCLHPLAHRCHFPTISNPGDPRQTDRQTDRPTETLGEDAAVLLHDQTEYMPPQRSIYHKQNTHTHADVHTYTLLCLVSLLFSFPGDSLSRMCTPTDSQERFTSCGTFSIQPGECRGGARRPHFRARCGSNYYCTCPVYTS